MNFVRIYAVVMTAALAFAGVEFLWFPYIKQFGSPLYTLLYRFGLTAYAALPALAVLVGVVSCPRGETRKWAAALGGLLVLAAIAWAGALEAIRLKTFSPKFPWSEILKATDMFTLGGILIALACLCGIWLASTFEPIKAVRNEPPPKRAHSSVHGSARWASIEEIEKIFPRNGRIPIGERYRVDQDLQAPPIFRHDDPQTWGQGGKAPLACFNLDFGSGHSLVFAGSGGYKTTANVIPALLHWPHNAVVLDPSLEIAPIVQEFREKKLRPEKARKIVVMDPSVPESGFNVLDWIGSGKGTMEEDISNVVSWITTGVLTKSDPDSFFRSSAQTLLTGVLAYICLDINFNKGPRTLKTLRDLISTDEKTFRTMIGEIHPGLDKNSLAYKALGPSLSMTEATFSGIYASAADLTKWLSFSRYADLVSGGMFESKELVQGDIDIFIALDLKTLDDHSGLARVIIGGLLNAMYNAGGYHKNNVLFVLDEAARLGGMKIIETARDAGRKNGISMQLIYQSVGQLKDQWGGETAIDKWFSSTSFQSFSAVNDLRTAEWLSKRCGNYTSEVASKSKNATGRSGLYGQGFTVSQSTNLVGRPLIRAEEIMSEMRRDDQIILVAGVPPIRCGRSIYFRRPEMMAVCGENRYGLKKDGEDGPAPTASLPKPQLPENGGAALTLASQAKPIKPTASPETKAPEIVMGAQDEAPEFGEEFETAGDLEGRENITSSEAEFIVAGGEAEASSVVEDKEANRPDSEPQALPLALAIVQDNEKEQKEEKKAELEPSKTLGL